MTQKTLQQWEEDGGYIIKDKRGLSAARKYTDKEIREITTRNNFSNIHGVNHKDRWEYLKKHGYNDPKYLTERTPEELA